MAINLKNSTTVLDGYIQSLQKFLYKKLKATWPVDDVNFESYGRAYRNGGERGYVPEVFVSNTAPNNTVYKPVKFEKDKMKAMFFFDLDDQQTYKEGTETVKIFIIFITNIALLKPDLPHRADEEVKNDVRKICSLGLYQLGFIGEESGFKNVFKRFDGLVNKDGEVFEDRHPLLCFKMNMELMYQPAEVNCPITV